MKYFGRWIFLVFSLVTLAYVAFDEIERGFFDFRQVAAERKGTRFLILWNKGLGEEEFVSRCGAACQKLGVECYVCSFHLNWLEKLCLKDPLQKVLNTLKPDFTLTLQHRHIHAPGFINYIALTHGVGQYVEEDGTPKNPEDLGDFAGYALSFADHQRLQRALQKEPFLAISWYPTCEDCFFKIPTPKKLFYCGHNWDAKRGGADYHKLFVQLDKTGYLAVFGPVNKWKHTPASLKGLLPFDGKSLVHAIQECGIVLILHSDEHIAGNAPTARIFEAASAGSVIISDRHPFVEEHFGDCVLFINQNSSPEELFQEIDKHVQWILSHPQEAQQMAVRAWEKYRPFALQEQITSLLNMHRQLTSNS